MSQNVMAGRVSLPIPLHLMFLNEKVTLLFMIGFPCFVLNCIYMMLFCFYLFKQIK